VCLVPCSARQTIRGARLARRGDGIRNPGRTTPRHGRDSTCQTGSCLPLPPPVGSHSLSVERLDAPRHLKRRPRGAVVFALADDLRLAKLCSALRAEQVWAGITGESRDFVRGPAGITRRRRGPSATAGGMSAGWGRRLTEQRELSSKVSNHGWAAKPLLVIEESGGLRVLCNRSCALRSVARCGRNRRRLPPSFSRRMNA